MANPVFQRRQIHTIQVFSFQEKKFTKYSTSLFFRGVFSGYSKKNKGSNPMKNLTMTRGATYQVYLISNISSHFNPLFKPTKSARAVSFETTLSLVFNIEKTWRTQKTWPFLTLSDNFLMLHSLIESLGIRETIPKADLNQQEEVKDREEYPYANPFE
jgi:hypothetical protein